MAAQSGQAEVCDYLLQHGADLKVLDIARRSPEMLARRNEHYNVLEVISKYHDSAEDEDAPLLVFRPFAGVFHSATPQDETNQSGLKAEDFKFDNL